MSTTPCVRDAGNVKETLSSNHQMSASVTSATVSNITQERDATHLCHLYSGLSQDDKNQFLKSFAAENNQFDVSVSKKLSKKLSSLTEKITISDTNKLHQQILSHLEPPYLQTFIKIGQLKGGVKFLVDMRKDLLYLIRQTDVKSSENDYAALKALNLNLKNLLSNWFSVGFLNLEQVTWQSPCSLVEKICDYEAVHPISSWNDIKKRVGNNRRCFVYTHPSMPGEPVVILHVALTPGHVSDDVDVLVRHQETNMTEDSQSVKTAIFYSGMGF